MRPRSKCLLPHGRMVSTDRRGKSTLVTWGLWLPCRKQYAKLELSQFTDCTLSSLPRCASTVTTQIIVLVILSLVRAGHTHMPNCGNSY